jgi:predicted aminopeptidase
VKRVIVLAAALALPGCSAIEFYWQGIAGQLDVFARAQPIDTVAARTEDARLRDRLTRAQAIRAYASRELALPDNGSYTRYADLGRPFVVWNVFAAPEFSLTPRQWCFPVAGCVNYRGYFAEADARAEAARLAGAGDDVYVGGVPAYSTLGYFDDPLLSSFIGYREPELARLLFHELAHQVVYVKDDTSFNESFAVAVEEEALARWIAAQRDRPEAAEFAAAIQRAARAQAGFRALVRTTRDRLRALYASGLPADEMRAAKAAIFAGMRAEFEQANPPGERPAAFERWFAAGANNAGIAALGLYADRVAEFRALLAVEGGDLPRFYARVKALAEMPKPERDAALAAAAARPGSG